MVLIMLTEYQPPKPRRARAFSFAVTIPRQ